MKDAEQIEIAFSELLSEIAASLYEISDRLKKQPYASVEPALITAMQRLEYLHDAGDHLLGENIEAANRFLYSAQTFTFEDCWGCDEQQTDRSGDQSSDGAAARH